MTLTKDKIINYSQQSIGEDDISAVIDVLNSGCLTQGAVTLEFEKELSEVCDNRYCLTTTNATAALHLSCLALNIGSGDMVWVSSISFVATANCARYCGANVDFVDVDPGSGLVTPTILREKFLTAVFEKRMPSAFVYVVFAGNPNEIRGIVDVCEEFDCPIIWDASHALGASFNKEIVGSESLGGLSVFSFHPVKTITSAEGGCVLTSSEELYSKMKLLRSHGIERGAFVKQGAEKHADYYYEQVALGFNYRMSELHAALGLSQLRKLSILRGKRERVAERYIEELSSVSGIKLPVLADGCVPSYHLFPILFDSKEIKDHFYELFRSNGFGVNVHYLPIGNHPYFSEISQHTEDCSGAKTFYNRALSIPLFPDLSNEHIEKICALLRHNL